MTLPRYTMKLTDLFKRNIITVTEAPELGPTQQLGLNNTEMLNQLDDTGYNIEGFPLLAKKFGDEIVFAIKDKETGDILSVIVGQIISDFPSNDDRETFQVLRSWTPPEFRRLGCSHALYYGLARLSYRLISDTQQSPEAQKLWFKLQQKLPDRVRLFDLQSLEYTESDPQENKDIVFVLEGTIRNQQKDSILEDSKFFTGEQL